MTCELSLDCPYFNEGTNVKPQTAALFKARYCRGHRHQCARYAVYQQLGREAVPTDLPPNEHLRAMVILRGAHPGVHPALR